MKLRYGHLVLLFAACLAAPVAHAATLNLVPVNSAVSVGDGLTINVSVSSADQALNAISGAISYPTDLLSIASISKADSMLTLWVEDPSFSNASGVASWSGVVPNPGFTGTGRVLSIRFVAKRTGVASVTFTSSAVLANDGNGTNILTSASPAVVSITAAAAPTPVQVAPTAEQDKLRANITSSTHPDQTLWYAGTHAVFDWTNAQGVTAVRLGYDQDASGVPTVSYTPAISHKEIDLGEGIWYFHVQEKNTGGWGPVATYRVQIDTTPPEPVALTFPNGESTASSTIAALFTTTDLLSGVSKYELAVDGVVSLVSAAEESGTYALPSGNTGAHTLVVSAYDKAGNKTVAQGRFFMTGEVAVPMTWTDRLWGALDRFSLAFVIILVILATAFLIWYIERRLRKFRKVILSREEEAHLLIHRRFKELKAALVNEIKSLEGVRSRRELTMEERHLIDRLQELVDRSETIMDDEIDTVIRKKNQEHPS